MYCLAGGSLQQIVEAGDHDQAPSVGRECKAEIAEVSAYDVLYFRQVGRGAEPDQRTALIEIMEHVGDYCRFNFILQPKVDGGQNSARYW